MPHEENSPASSVIASLNRLHPAIIFAVVVIVALLARLLVLDQIQSDPDIRQVGGDGLAYLDWAHRIARVDWLGHEVFYASPLYPYLLAVHQRLFGTELTTLLLVQSIVGAIGCGVLVLAARKLFDPLSGLLAGLLMALFPAAISYDLQVDKTVLDPPLVAAMLWCLASLLRRPTPSLWLICGVVIGIFSLTRENALALLLPIILWMAWCFRNHSLQQRTVRAAATLIAGAAIVIVPVCVRNSVIAHEFHLSTAKFGPNFYYGNAAIADGIYFPLRPGRGDLRFEQQDATELAEEAQGQRLTTAEVSSYWTRRTMREIAADPARWLRLTLRKFAMVWCDTEIADADVHDRHVVNSAVLRALDSAWGFGVVFALALAGAVMVWRARKAEVAILLLLAFTYALAIAAFILFGRYRLPIVPMLMPLAAVAIAELPGVIRKRQWTLLLGAVTAAALAVGIVFLGEHSIPARIRGSNPYNRAILFAARGKIDSAISHYRRAIRQNLTLEPAYVNLSLLLTNRGQVDQGEQLAQQALKLDPNDAAAHTNLGVALGQKGRTEQAIQAFTRAIELSPGDRAARLNLAIALLQLGRGERAMPLLNELATTQPADEFSRRAKKLLNQMPASTMP